MAIGLGTVVSWHNARPSDAENLAQALVGVTEGKNHGMWQYPKENKKGAVREIGGCNIEFVRIFWDGRTLQLSIIGNAPSDKRRFRDYLNRNGVKISSDFDMTSYTPIN